MKRYGKRIKNGNNGDVEWCELSEEGIIAVLLENVRLNGIIWDACYQEARKRGDAREDGRPGCQAMESRFRAEVLNLSNVLFEASSVKSFVALQEALDERVHLVKAKEH